MGFLNRKIVRYVAVGIATVLVDYLCYAVIFYLTNNYLLAENLKLPIVLGFNYLAHRVFTFKSSEKRVYEISRYIAANVLIWFVANLSLVVLVGLTGDAMLAKLLQLGIMPVFTYFVLSYLVYAK